MKFPSFNLNAFWYGASNGVNFLRPLSWLYRGAITLRRYCYRKKIFKSTKFPVPIIVVGNITVGGTGKTPLVQWLVNWLREQGYRPGLVSRGYKGRSTYWPRRVDEYSNAIDVGDEALLLFQQTKCPMVVGPNRVLAVQELLNTYPCDVVISDDGLQHYALDRNIEIAVIDAKRNLGNELCLPAGPLREPKTRLNEVDIIIYNGSDDVSLSTMQLIGENLHAVANPHQQTNISTFSNKVVHAVAGIGHPERFFEVLRGVGLRIIPHAFPDHHFYKAHEIGFGHDEIVIMTEKDAVKCKTFADQRHWYFPVKAVVNDVFKQKLAERLTLIVK